MGYAVYEDLNAASLGVTRWAGYAVPAICDYPDCGEGIDRGLGYLCGTSPGDGQGCGLYFCSHHKGWTLPCDHGDLPPKPDTPEWERHMLTDDSWQQWRDENPQMVAEMSERVAAGGAS